MRRSYFGALVVVATMALLCMLAGRSGAAAGDTTRVSVATDGTQANGPSHSTPSISADGRFVAFDSAASNLVPNDTNSKDDVFVRDRQDGTTERVSLDSSGNQGNDYSFKPAISANGRFVAFVSSASNFFAGDTNRYYDVFVHDRTTGTTELVNVNSPEGVDPNGPRPSISADGRFVTFSSAASDLVAGGDTNGVIDVFVRDLQTGTTRRVSVNNDGTQATGGTSETPSSSISADGRFVTFTSSSILAAGDTSGRAGLFVRDRDADADGVFDEAGASSTQWLSRGGDSSINADGRYVAFLSTASDLVAGGDTNGVTDVFVHERDPSSTQPPDSIDPITTRTLSPQPNAAGWNNSDVTVTLNATDTGGSGLKEINYSINGGASTTVQQSSVQIPVTNEGTTTISYQSTDNAGNVEPEQTLTVKIDKSAPSVSTATPTGKGVARSTNAVATFSERVNRDSVSASTFKLFKCSSTTSTECPTRITNVAITKSTDGLSATLNPYGSSTTQLAKNTKYKAVVTTGVTDEAGNHLDQNATTSGNQNKVWYFTTGLT